MISGEGKNCFFYKERNKQAVLGKHTKTHEKVSLPSRTKHSLYEGILMKNKHCTNSKCSSVQQHLFAFVHLCLLSTTVHQKWYKQQEKMQRCTSPHYARFLLCGVTLPSGNKSLSSIISFLSDPAACHSTVLTSTFNPVCCRHAEREHLERLWHLF